MPTTPSAGGGEESFERSYSYTGDTSSRRYDRTLSAGAQRMEDIPEARDSPSPTFQESPHSPQNETAGKPRVGRVPVPSLTGSVSGGGRGRGMLKADFVGRMHRQSQVPEAGAMYA